MADARLVGQPGRGPGGDVAVLLGQLLVLLQVRRLDGQQVCAGHDLVKGPRAGHVPDKAEFGPGHRLPQHVFRLDHPPIGQGHRLALDQLPANGALGHPQGFGSGIVEGPPGVLLEGEAEAAGPSMHHRERLQLEVLVLEERPRLDHVQIDPSASGISRPKDHVHESLHPGNGRRAAENVQLFQGFPTAQGAGQPAQPQDVVQVAMGKEDAIQPSKAQATAQDLALSALSTVDHESVFVHHHQRGGESPVDGRSRCGRAEKDEFKHGNHLSGMRDASGMGNEFVYLGRWCFIGLCGRLG